MLTIGLVGVRVQVDRAWYQLGRPLQVPVIVVKVRVLYQRALGGFAVSVRHQGDVKVVALTV